ncbi:MAG TPA: glycosyltransferase [Gemmataceae bacterium]|nr:glycosyltransferase [Gemmataceae bacterium]
MAGTHVRKVADGRFQAAKNKLWPIMSFVVPVRNEAPYIEKLLIQLLHQDFDAERFEVIVADGQSTDGTAEIVRRMLQRYANLRLIDNPKQWASAGRNVAIQAAAGEIVVVVDGHCDIATSYYLSELAEIFARTGADCVGRPQPLDVTGATSLQRAIAAARSSWLGHNPDSLIYSAREQFVRPQSVAVAYRRSVFETVGLFDENFDACEDVEFNHRLEKLGLRCYFSPRVGVQYHPRQTLGGLFYQMARYGRGRMRLLRKHPEYFTPACFLPALFCLGMILGPVLALVFPLFGLVYGGALSLYAFIVLVASGIIGFRKKDWRIFPWLPCVFPAIHLGAGAGILKELFFGWRRKRPASNPVLVSLQD